MEYAITGRLSSRGGRRQLCRGDPWWLRNCAPDRLRPVAGLASGVPLGWAPFDREPGAIGTGLYVGAWMPDPLSRTERIRKEAAKFICLAESPSSSFLRDYYRRLAERYLALEGVYCGPVLRHPAELMLPAVDLGGRVWLGGRSCKGGPAAPAFGG